MIVGYCRIGILKSTAALDAQKRALATIGAQEFFCEKSGLFASARQLERAIEFAQKGDVIAITRSYCVARSTRGVLTLIDRLGRKGVGLRILGTPVDTSTTTGRMILGSVPLGGMGISPVGAALRDVARRCWRRR